MSMTLTIGSTDFSSFLDEKSYDVNSEALYIEWKDGNGIEHHDIYRQKVSGSFNLEFWKQTDYAKIITELGNATSGYCSVTCHVNNLAANGSYNLFIKMKPEFVKGRTGAIVKWIAKCTVGER